MLSCRHLLSVSSVLVLLLVAGCATPLPTGICYTNVKLPVSSSGESVSHSKVGIAKCHTLFGLVARGDASIETAARNGGIKSISHVDFSARSILGVAGEYTTTVYGD